MNTLGIIMGTAIAGAMSLYSVHAKAAETCSGCIADYNTCIADGGSSATCWTCNNPRCLPPAVKPAASNALAIKEPGKDRLRTKQLKTAVKA